MNIECTNRTQISEDGWMQLAPFGDFPGRARVLDDSGKIVREVDAIQRLDAEAANEIVSEFNSPLRRVGRWFRGLPIFNGHPDAPGIGSQYPDKAEKGQLVDLAVRPDGLYGKPSFSAAGVDLLNSTSGLAPSVRWSSRHFADEGDKPVLRPTRLVSVGLTRTPNLPVEALNSKSEGDASASQESTDMKLETILALLKKHGIEVANTADEAAVASAIEAGIVGNVIRHELQAEVTNTKAALETSKTELETANAATTAAKAEVTNERSGRIGDLLDMAQLSGRITEAERATWKGRLEADFTNERANLLKAEQKVRTTSQVSGERKATTAGKSPTDQLVEIANAKFEEHPQKVSNPNTAWVESYQAAQREHPELVQAMTPKAQA
jgi:hypothetical protein